MARSTWILAVTAFAAASAAAFLPFPTWLRAFYWALVLAGLTLFAAVGWGLEAWREWKDDVFPPLLASAVGLAPLTVSYLLVGGPGRLPPMEQVTLDLSSWLPSALGLGGALACLGFGALAAVRGRGPARGAGLCMAAVGLLAPQAAARDAGLPNLGAPGSLVLLAVLLAAAVVSAFFSRI